MFLSRMPISAGLDCEPRYGRRRLAQIGLALAEGAYVALMVGAGKMSCEWMQPFVAELRSLIHRMPRNERVRSLGKKGEAIWRDLCDE